MLTYLEAFFVRTSKANFKSDIFRQNLYQHMNHENIVWPPPPNKFVRIFPASLCKATVIGAWYAPPIGALPFALPEMNSRVELDLLWIEMLAN